MEIEKDHQSQNTGLSMTEEQKPAPNVCNKQDNHNSDKDEDDGDSDSGSMTCPLFMEGLPRNFATNPQLAAIASLLDDEVREENNADVENDSKDDQKNDDKNKILGHPSRAPSSQTTTISKHTKTSGKARTRRHRKKSSPYPRPQDRTKERQQAKKTSVGEITLFMNMWKP